MTFLMKTLLGGSRNAGILILIAFTIGACAPDQVDMRMTVERLVLVAAESTDEARPTQTAYPTATAYPRRTLQPSPTAEEQATAYPTATFYPTTTRYPTYTPIPTDTPIATPIPRPTSAPLDSPPASAPGTIMSQIFNMMTDTRNIILALDGAVGIDTECHTFVTNYDRLVNSPSLDVSNAPIEFQGAYFAYRDYVEKKSGVASISDMAVQCRDLLASGEQIGRFDRKFWYQVFLDIIGDDTLSPALRSIGG